MPNLMPNKKAALTEKNIERIPNNSDGAIVKQMNKTSIENEKIKSTFLEPHFDAFSHSHCFILPS